MFPPSNKPRCNYCNQGGHVEEKCFKKQRDQKKAKEETRLQEQRPFPPSDPPTTKKLSSKRRRIRQDKRIAALALKLSQKHLAQAEESNRLKLTASAASDRDPRAGRGKTTTNKNSKPTSKPASIGLKDLIKSVTKV